MSSSVDEPHTGETLPANRRCVIAVGASAGGVEAIRELVRSLPRDLPAAVLVAIHFPGHLHSTLPDILSRVGTLPASHAVHGERIRQGHIYVAPPDNHLTTMDSILRVVRGPKENGHRPAVDALFRTAARSFGRRLVGVVLTGSLDCGALGLSVVRAHGGIGMVQDPAEAPYPDMPTHALEQAKPEYVLRVAQMGERLTQLCSEQLPSRPERAEPSARNESFPLTCPECHGGVVELDGPGGAHVFECRVGHTFSADTMLVEQAQSTENALWAALRSLEESAQLADRMATRSERLLRPRFEDKAAGLRQHADVLRQLLMRSAGEAL